MSLRRPLLALSLLAASSGCATSAPATRGEDTGTQTAAAATPAAPAAPQNVQAMFQRELPPLKKVAVRGPEGRFTAEVEAAGEVTVKRDEEFVDIVIPLGTGQDVECIVYPERISAGRILHSVLAGIREKVQVRAQRPAAVLALKEAPAVVLETLYTFEQGGKPVGGMLKMMVHAEPSLPVLCMHDEAGYSATFQRVVSGLLSSLRLGEDQDGYPRPLYTELHLVRVGKQPVGFDWRSVYEGKEEGTRVDESVSALLMPQSPTEMVFSDSRSVNLLDARGQLQEATHEETNNGEQEMALSLERQKGGKSRRYAYEGLHSGKEVKGTFEAPRGLTTEAAMVAQVRSRLPGTKAGQLPFDIYVPDANPAAPTTVTYRREGKEPTALTVQMAGMQFTGTTDAQGLLVRYSVPLGSASLEAERLFVRGTP